MTGTRVRWLALTLAALGIAGLSMIAIASISSPILSVALAAAIFVLLLPIAAYFVFRPRRGDDR